MRIRFALVWLSLVAGSAPLSARADTARVEPLGVQTCDTQCQSDKTDCELACDQVVSCVEQCQKVAAACVEQCRSAPPPEKAAPPPKKPPAKSAKAAKPKK